MCHVNVSAGPAGEAKARHDGRRRHPRGDRPADTTMRRGPGGERRSCRQAVLAEGEAPPPFDAVAMAPVEEQEVVAERMFEQ